MFERCIRHVLYDRTIGVDRIPGTLSGILQTLLDHTAELIRHVMSVEIAVRQDVCEAVSLLNFDGEFSCHGLIEGRVAAQKLQASLRPDLLNCEMICALYASQIMIEQERLHDNKVRPNNFEDHRPQAPKSMALMDLRLTMP